MKSEGEEMIFPCPHCDIEIKANALNPECPSCQAPLILGGRFRLEGLLGRGGMGIVYMGKDLQADERVAIKTLSISSMENWKNDELFERNIRLLKGLNHTGIPKVFGAERDSRGKLFLVRECLDGGTLEERIQHKQRLDQESFTSLFIGMLETLDYLHKLLPPIIHRDIKPANIMFRGGGDWRPVLVDFDTAADTQPGEGLTIVGTPGYSAPEQSIGDSSPLSDLYSLGVSILSAVTHLEPSQMARRDGEFDFGEQLDGLGEGPKRVLLQMVQSDRKGRPQSARRALEMLKNNTSKQHRKNPKAKRQTRKRRSIEDDILEVFSLGSGEKKKGRVARRNSSSEESFNIEKIRQEGWLKQVPKNLKPFAIIGAIIVFFSIPFSSIGLIIYFLWRKGTFSSLEEKKKTQRFLSKDNSNKDSRR